MHCDSRTYSRGQLGQLTGVKSETIRYYEQCGLLQNPARTIGGHRVYTDVHKRQLDLIRRCRELGFSISEISELLTLFNAGQQTCEQIRCATAEHLVDVQAKIKDLRIMERALKGLIKQCDENTSDDCPVIDALMFHK
jgi:MerR family transcriptional regulator, mercuric resistance operon regulatory protein